MEAKIITEPDRQRWNDFVSSSGGSVLQSFEWGELKSESGWEPIRIALGEGSRISAAISVLKKPLPMPGRSLFYAPRGPVVPLENPDLLDGLLEAVREQAVRHKAVALKIDPPVPEGKAVDETLKSRGFIKKKKQVQPRTTYFIDLTMNSDDLLKSFEEKTRYNIRLSAKKGVEVRLENTNKGVEDFYSIYRETASRDNFLIHPKSYYQSIKRILVDRGMASIFLAYHRGIPIAGVYIFNFGDKIWYMYGASRSESRNVMPNHALHWEVIKWAKEKGLRVYDLWGIPSNPREGHPLWGVYRFKKGFRGSLVKYAGVYDLPFDALMYHVSDKGFALLKGAVSLLKKGKISDSLEE